jgi:putative copper resistance protein D
LPVELLPGLLLDHLSVPLRGLAVTAQSLAVGGVAFFLLLAVPLAPRLGPALGTAVLRRAGRITARAGLAVALTSLARIALQLTALVSEVGIPLGRALGAGFVGAWGAQALAGVAVAALLRRGRRPSGAGAVAGLATAALAIIAGSVATSHAAGRLELGLLLGVATALHELGAAVWIGGLPCFLAALALAGDDGAPLRAIGRRYSLVSMAGVAALAGAGIVLAVAYVGSWPALYATAYGLTAGVKVVLFLALLGLGAANYRVVERLRRDPTTPALRLRRFAEVELGVGVAAFLTAASLTSVPPGVDVKEEDRVTPAEIAGRVWPPAPRLRSPAHDPAVLLSPPQAQPDPTEAAPRGAQASPLASGGTPPPGDAFDAAWSEFEHDRAGLLLLAVGGLAIAERSGLPWGRRWPLLFPAFAILLALEADLAIAPPRDIGPSTELGGAGDARHHAGARHLATVLAALAMTAIGLCEWGVRTGWVRDPRAARVFPLACAGVALLLLSHGHAAPDPKGALLVSISHDLVALLGLGAASSRWIELRLAGSRAGRAAGWAWPACLLAIGIVLLGYREAPSPGGWLQPERSSWGIELGVRSRDVHRGDA